MTTKFSDSKHIFVEKSVEYFKINAQLSAWEMPDEIMDIKA